MRTYLLKKSEKSTPAIQRDQQLYVQMTTANNPDKTTYYTAKEQLTINFISLMIQEKTKKFFGNQNLKKTMMNFLIELIVKGSQSLDTQMQ